MCCIMSLGVREKSVRCKRVTRGHAGWRLITLLLSSIHTKLRTGMVAYVHPCQVAG